MSMMIPSVLSPEVKSNAERRIFEWFRNAPGTDKWIVLHSLGITTHNKVIYGETDFLVLAPGLGIFALEVKGGRVSRENGIWCFTDRYDKTSCKARGPFDQARDGIFSIVDSIKSRLDIAHLHIGKVLFGYGVMFPDIEFTCTGIDEEQWQVFDTRDGNMVAQFIKRLSDGVKAKWESHYGALDSSKLPDLSDIKYIATLLRGDFDYVVPLGIQFQNSNDAIVALTKEQYRCLDQLDDNPRCLIQGPAGTGKTLLAIEEVKKSVASGEKVAFFCFNTNLANWLSSYFETVPENVRPEYVGTFHKYMTRVAMGAGMLPSYPHDTNMVQQYYKEVLPSAASKALVDCKCLYDKIVVDEAQDLIQDSYLEVMDACLQKGISRGSWTMFGDFSMQAIYADGTSGQKMIDKLEERTSFIRFKLTINCRNTKSICKEIETITGFDASNGLWTNVDGPPVQCITWSSMEDQSKKLGALLRQLEEAHISPDKITILSPKRRDDSVVSILEGYKITDFKVPCTTDTTFCTIQAYKGLENTVIILTDIEGLSSDKLMYVGLSRARSGLFILESDAAKREYDNLLIRRLLHG